MCGSCSTSPCIKSLGVGRQDRTRTNTLSVPAARLVLFLLMAASSQAQSTQAIVSGRVIDGSTGRAIAQATVTCRSFALNVNVQFTTTAAGYFAFTELSPGDYEVDVDAGAKYQRQELHSLELFVASRLELDFRLRPIQDVWEAGRYRSVILPNSRQEVTLIGPDVDTSRSGNFDANRGKLGESQTSLSYVVTEQDIDRLPLAGRDVFAQLVLMPGATADTGTARGLGLSFMGARPSSSNYLLDGLEFNNSVVTGPAARIAPEAVLEYRVSTSNYAAEYGRTAGPLANAVTRSGTAAWHADAYAYLENDIFNANGFQENASGYARAPIMQWQPGFRIGGPLLRDRLFAFSSFEYFRSRTSGDPQQYVLPTAAFISATGATSTTGAFLREFPAEVVPQTSGDVGTVTIRPPQSLDRYLGTVRLDYAPAGGVQRGFLRILWADQSQPDLLFSPYPGFSSNYSQKDLSIAAGWTTKLRATATNEFRAGWTFDDIRLPRPHPEVPILEVDCSNSCNSLNPEAIILPESYAAYSYLDRDGKWELLDNLEWVHGPNVVKIGGGVFRNDIHNTVDLLGNGLYAFGDLQQFQAASPAIVLLELPRGSASAALPKSKRQYRYTQSDIFFDHSVRVTSRLTINWGLRYEFLGPPSNVGGTKDALIALGPGPSIQQRITSAAIAPVGSGAQRMYDPDFGDIAVRFGFAYELAQWNRAVLRGSYGIFYDRPFDNLWQTITANSVIPYTWNLSRPVDYLGSPVAVAAASGTPIPSNALTPPVVYQPGLKNGRAQNLFLGVQEPIVRGLTVEANVTSSLGRRLITTDIVNRPGDVSATSTNGQGRLNPAFQELYYRANQGKSDYFGLTTVVRQRFSRVQSMISYTWAHVIDVQSDPLASELLNYNFLDNTPMVLSSFAREFDSQGDRGNADFDQRYNLVFSSTATLPGPGRNGTWAKVLRNWEVSGVGAIRSGFPFTVFASPDSLHEIENQRANLVSGQAALTSSSAPGGMQLLNPQVFAQPAAGVVGDTGRNAFRGPGLYSVDLSIARTFAIPWLPEGWRMTVRADAFNVLNHANLNNPDNRWCAGGGCPAFGTALYGRVEQSSGFPLLAPLSETSRQVQVLVRIAF